MKKKIIKVCFRVLLFAAFIGLYVYIENMVDAGQTKLLLEQAKDNPTYATSQAISAARDVVRGIASIGSICFISWIATGIISIFKKEEK